MAQEDMLPYQALIETVRDFCTQRRTGTVFIVSSDNRMAQVHLESGAIVALLCRGRRGLDAIAGIRDMIAGRLRFDDNFVSASETERFDTDQTLALLGCCAVSGNGAAAAPRTASAPSTVAARPAAPAPARAPAPAPASASGGVITPAYAAKLESILTQYIGPMAEIVCADHVAEAGDLKSLVIALSGEVPDKGQAAQFVRDAQLALGLA